MTESEIKWSMSRLPVFQRMLDAACMAAAAGAEQAVVSDANTVSLETHVTDGVVEVPLNFPSETPHFSSSIPPNT